LHARRLSRQARPGGFSPAATLSDVRERCLFSLGSCLLHPIEVELQRLGICHTQGRLLGVRRGLVFQLQVAGAHFTGTVLLQLVREPLALA
jgi:hypothetical protein